MIEHYGRSWVRPRAEYGTPHAAVWRRTSAPGRTYAGYAGVQRVREHVMAEARPCALQRWTQSRNVPKAFGNRVRDNLTINNA
jgi:hypothetical protein